MMAKSNTAEAIRSALTVPRRATAESAASDEAQPKPESTGLLEGGLKRRVGAFQEYVYFVWRAAGNTFTERWSDLVIQMDVIGFGSLPIVLLTGLFTGCVLALQSASALRDFGALSMTPTLVTKSMLKELGPVITGLMISGRNASGIASELGSMKITDQLDAMRSLGTDPMRKLATPRLIATTTMLFFLTILSDTVGIAGGALVAVFSLGLDANKYLHTSYQCIQWQDLIQGLLKPIVFGFIISSIGCDLGMNATGGTQGVGKATTRAVVLSSVLIIVVDYMISRTMISLFGG